MLINILCLIIGVALTLVWINLVKPKTPLNFQVFVKDKFWLITTGSLIVAIGYLYFYLPQVFEWLAVEFWGVPSSTITEDGKTKVLQLTDLGPLGDIYGSLNTLFTSATLAFVVYATLLQRQANHDAREAMAKQLQQAKEDTEEQLKQAREATEQQILNAQQLADIQLSQTKEVSSRQLELAQVTHDAQIKESKDAIFSNMFYALLSQKYSKYNNLVIRNEDTEFDSIRIFSAISNRLLRLLKDDWINAELLNEEIIQNELRIYLKSLTKKSATIHELHSYFLIYGDLLNLIKRSKLDPIDEIFFKNIVINSMTVTEQITLFWIGAYLDKYKLFLKDSGIFNQFFHVNMMPFAKKFFDESYFSHSKVIAYWNEKTEQGTPT